MSYILFIIGSHRKRASNGVLTAFDNSLDRKTVTSAPRAAGSRELGVMRTAAVYRNAVNTP